MTINTPRLRIAPVGPGEDPEEFLPVFNSNPDFLEAADGKSSYDRGDAEMYLYSESNRENGRCLAIRERDGGSLVGTAALLVPHPGNYAWIGLLIVDGKQQGRGFGREAVLAVEDALAREGWDEVRLSVLKSNEPALPFWKRLGYRVVEEKEDTAGRPCWVLGKRVTRDIAAEV
jgi:ribosomal protein S18 acetylase RimI-like enzyme